MHLCQHEVLSVPAVATINGKIRLNRSDSSAYELANINTSSFLPFLLMRIKSNLFDLGYKRQSGILIIIYLDVFNV